MKISLRLKIMIVNMLDTSDNRKSTEIIEIITISSLSKEWSKGVNDVITSAFALVYSVEVIAVL